MGCNPLEFLPFSRPEGSRRTLTVSLAARWGAGRAGGGPTHSRRSG
ncbi:hypothetical protein D187_001594 [Cystobacter fuscus DSM 2262]|uniref:Uncharacterized protein n=1 Tax=Cystobacter fuscus (strain ATCC 25194 / DSM 2262 / NBRC 100088 / M29) TaxID=1242864 RepID=S9PEZ5_CYSF2|nr:hypothetical protein D187_001594 [Cystobacter fuscus DSM 2262]